MGYRPSSDFFFGWKLDPRVWKAKVIKEILALSEEELKAKLTGKDCWWNADGYLTTNVKERANVLEDELNCDPCPVVEAFFGIKDKDADRFSKFKKKTPAKKKTAPADGASVKASPEEDSDDEGADKECTFALRYQCASDSSPSEYYFALDLHSGFGNYGESELPIHDWVQKVDNVRGVAKRNRDAEDDDEGKGAKNKGVSPPVALDAIRKTAHDVFGVKEGEEPRIIHYQYMI